MSSFSNRLLRRVFFIVHRETPVLPAVAGAVLCLGLAVSGTMAYAQAAETEDGEAIVANAANAAPNYNSLPPDTYPVAPSPLPQQAERQNRLQETNIRNLMRSFGVNARDMQDLVISHISNETQAREPMRAASGRLLQAMRTPGVTEAQLGVLLNDCRVSFDTDRMRRADALESLKDKIGLALTPRIESMILLLGLEGDVIITLPSPTMLSQMQRERQQLLRMVDGLKLEADSLRRERDDIKAERDAFARPNVPNPAIHSTANAQINPNGLYNAPEPTAVPVLSEELKEVARLREENARMKKENQRLQRENTTLRHAAKEETGGVKEQNKNDKR